MNDLITTYITTVMVKVEQVISILYLAF